MTPSSFMAIGLTLALGAPSFATIEWDFDVGNNSRTPAADVGSGTATIDLGPLGTGWHNADLNLGTQSGYWDLGASGQIALEIPIRPGPNTLLTTTLTVVQFVDSFPFTGGLTYSFPGSVQVGTGTQSSIEDTTPFGQWIAYTTVWKHPSPVIGNEQITIMAPFTGAVVHRVSLDNVLTAVPEPTTLIAGVLLLLLPFGASALRILRRKPVG